MPYTLCVITYAWRRLHTNPSDWIKIKGLLKQSLYFLAPQTGLEPVTLRLTVWCSLISIIFHTSINFQKWLKTRSFWVSYKINNVYYLTYVYRFCSQFCSQNNFRDFKLEPMTIRKIHMCSYINWALCFSSFDVIFFSSRVSVCCRTFRYVPLLPLSHGCLCTDLFDAYWLFSTFRKQRRITEIHAELFIFNIAVRLPCNRFVMLPRQSPFFGSSVLFPSFLLQVVFRYNFLSQKQYYVIFIA